MRQAVLEQLQAQVVEKNKELALVLHDRHVCCAIMSDALGCAIMSDTCAVPS